jgi:succinate dehydrogenase / fumarate reductase flavoprotein subunit
MVPGSPRQQMTNIPGLYAAGECDYAYHGANRLGANSLLSCIYAGMIVGPSMVSYAKNNMKSKGDVPSSLLAGARKQWDERFAAIYKMDGPENPYVIGQQMGEVMIKAATVVKVNAQIDAALPEIQALKDRWKRCNVLDTGRTVNQSATYVNQLWNMLEIAHLILKASRLRDESRGSHYKPEFVLPKPTTAKPADDPQFMAAWKERNAKWLKNSMGRWTPEGPQVTFEDLQSLKNPILAPEPRHYD